MHELRVKFQRLRIKKMAINMNKDDTIIQSIPFAHCFHLYCEIKELLLFYPNKILLRLRINNVQ